MAATKAIRESAVGERAQHFLKALIERYIRDGQPVGSRTLAKDSGLEFSPATIRNVMADLEEMGLVASPHASAGRVPTVSGYRMFLDSLLTLEPLKLAEIESMRGQLGGTADESQLISTASQLLSGVTHMAGVVMLPRHGRNEFRQIEFLPLSGTQVLAILVTSDGEVHNRILEMERRFSPLQLEQATNYLNERFSGQDMGEVRKRLLEEIKQTRKDMDLIMVRAVELASRLVENSEPRDDVMIAGQTNLMEFDELASMEQLKQLFEAFTQKTEILHLLDRCVRADGVQIFIGEESGYQLLNGCSVVTASYKLDDQVVGVLGVIGPTRMDYQRVIPIVDVTAKLLSAALKHA